MRKIIITIAQESLDDIDNIVIVLQGLSLEIETFDRTGTIIGLANEEFILQISETDGVEVVHEAKSEQS